MKNLPKIFLFTLLLFVVIPLFNRVYAQSTVVCDLNSHTEAPCKDINGNIIGYETAACKGYPSYAVVTKSCSGSGGGGGVCLNENKYIDFIAPDETKTWSTYNGGKSTASSPILITKSFTSQSNKLSFIASATRRVGISSVGNGGIKVVNKTTNKTYTSTKVVRDIPCTSAYNASNRFTFGETGQCRPRKYDSSKSQWLGCYYGMQNDMAMEQEGETQCGWRSNPALPIWAEEATIQIDKSELAAGNNIFEVSLLDVDDITSSCLVKNFVYDNGDKTPPLVSPTPTYSCSADAKTAIVNWNAEQASFYSVRLDGENNGWGADVNTVCSAGVNGLNGDYCFDTIDNLQTSAGFSVIPNTDNRFWIHSNRYITGNSGAYEWGGASELIVKCSLVANDPPVCTSPVITPTGNISTTFSATGTATDDKGIKRTGIYIYKKSPSAHVREIQSNTTVNTSNSLTTSWDLKDDAGNVVSDGNYEIHYNWYDVEGAMAQCKTDFTKLTPVIPTTCTAVLPTGQTYNNGTVATFSTTVKGQSSKNVNVYWSSSCGGVFNGVGASSYSATLNLTGANQNVSSKSILFPNANYSSCKLTAKIQEPDGTFVTCPPSTYNTKESINFVDVSGDAVFIDKLDKCPSPASAIWTTAKPLSGATLKVTGSSIGSMVTGSDGEWTAHVQVPAGTSHVRLQGSSDNSDYGLLCFKKDTTIMANGSSYSVTAGDNIENVVALFGYAPPAYLSTFNGGEVYSNNSVNFTKPNTASFQYFATLAPTITSGMVGGMISAKSSVSSEWTDKTIQGIVIEGLSGYSLRVDESEYIRKVIEELDKGIDLSATNIKYFNSSQNFAYSALKSLNGNVIIVDGNVTVFDNDEQDTKTNPANVIILSTGTITVNSGVGIPENTSEYLGSFLTTNNIQLPRSKSHKLDITTFKNIFPLNFLTIASNLFSKDWSVLNVDVKDKFWTKFIAIPTLVTIDDLKYDKLPMSTANSKFFDDVDTYVSSSYDSMDCNSNAQYNVDESAKLQYKKLEIPFKNFWEQYNNKILISSGDINVTDISDAPDNVTDIAIIPTNYQVPIKVTYEPDIWDCWEDTDKPIYKVCSDPADLTCDSTEVIGYDDTCGYVCSGSTTTENFDFPYNYSKVTFNDINYSDGNGNLDDKEALYIQKRIYPTINVGLSPAFYLQSGLKLLKVSNLLWKEIY